MLFGLLTMTLFASLATAEENGLQRVQYFPLPLDLPTRNEKAEQCYLRVEDAEIVETLSIYCHLAHAFLRNHIREYNTRKQEEDRVEVGPWAEEKSSDFELGLYKDLPEPVNQKNVKDWKLTTILDPITHIRLYVSEKADCRIIMYNREGTTNYRVNCDKILFFVNSHSSNSAESYGGKIDFPFLAPLIAMIFVFLGRH